jgi:hypothetical protein
MNSVTLTKLPSVPMFLIGLKNESSNKLMLNKEQLNDLHYLLEMYLEGIYDDAYLETQTVECESAE